MKYRPIIIFAMLASIIFTGTINIEASLQAVIVEDKTIWHHTGQAENININYDKQIRPGHYKTAKISADFVGNGEITLNFDVLNTGTLDAKIIIDLITHDIPMPLEDYLTITQSAKNPTNIAPGDFLPISITIKLDIPLTEKMFHVEHFAPFNLVLNYAPA